MKRIIFLSFLLCSTILYSQERDKPIEIRASFGVKAFNNLYAQVLGNALNGDVSLSPTPSFLIDCDMQISKRFSIGVTAYYSNTQMRFVDEDSNSPSYSSRYMIHNLGIMAKPLFHYGHTEKRNFYSGLRVGQAYTKFVHENLNGHYLSIRSLPFIGAQIIPIGFRKSINESWRYNIELGLGSIHNISFGISYQLP